MPLKWSLRSVFRTPKWQRALGVKDAFIARIRIPVDWLSGRRRRRKRKPRHSKPRVQ